MLNVKIEVFRPYRQEISVIRVAESDLTFEQKTEQVNRFVTDMIPTISLSHPTVTEIRWEYTQYGQGHYITKIGDKWCGC